MFEWFLYISLAIAAWLAYEIITDKVKGPGRWWITINVEGDAERVEYLIRQLAKDQKIKIRSYKISAEKPKPEKKKRFFSFRKRKKGGIPHEKAGSHLSDFFSSPRRQWG